MLSCLQLFHLYNPAFVLHLFPQDKINHLFIWLESVTFDRAPTWPIQSKILHTPLTPWSVKRPNRKQWGYIPQWPAVADSTAADVNRALTRRQHWSPARHSSQLSDRSLPDRRADSLSRLRVLAAHRTVRPVVDFQRVTTWGINSSSRAAWRCGAISNHAGKVALSLKDGEFAFTLQRRCAKMLYC